VRGREGENEVASYGVSIAFQFRLCLRFHGYTLTNDIQAQDPPKIFQGALALTGYDAMD
jgi:hypothetical protein